MNIIPRAPKIQTVRNGHHAEDLLLRLLSGPAELVETSFVASADGIVYALGILLVNEQGTVSPGGGPQPGPTLEQLDPE